MFNYKKMCFTMIYSIFSWHSGDIKGYIGHCLGDVRFPMSKRAVNHSYLGGV